MYASIFRFRRARAREQIISVCMSLTSVARGGGGGNGGTEGKCPNVKISDRSLAETTM